MMWAVSVQVVKTVVVKYVGDTFLDLSCEKQPAHPDKKGALNLSGFVAGRSGPGL